MIATALSCDQLLSEGRALAIPCIRNPTSSRGQALILISDRLRNLPPRANPLRIEMTRTAPNQNTAAKVPGPRAVLGEASGCKRDQVLQLLEIEGTRQVADHSAVLAYQPAGGKPQVVELIRDGAIGVNPGWIGDTQFQG